MEVKHVLEFINNTASKAFLVGGGVRDLLLGNSPHDMDLVVPGRAIDLVYKLEEVVNIRPVILDEEHDVVRAVFSGGYVDIAGLGTGRLEENLKRRDFTINAMALPVETYIKGDWAGNIIDPLGGLEDLRQGLIRGCSSQVMEDDPLRVLRALRFKGGLDFRITSETVYTMRNLQRPLSTVPGERVWEELRRILVMPDSAGVFRYLHYEINILQQVFPEAGLMERMEQNYYHADNVWKHCLKALLEFERHVSNNNFTNEVKTIVQQYLCQLLAGKRNRLPVIKLACLFHDVGKLETRGERDGRITFYGHHQAGGPMAEVIGRRLKMSKAELRLFRQLVEQHMQPLFLYRGASDKAVFRFFRSTGEETPGCLLLSLADVTSSRTAIGRHDLAIAYAEYIMELIKRYAEKKEWLLNSNSLLSGRDICNTLNIHPGPPVGKLKNKLQEAQMEGKVNTRQEAEDYIREVYREIVSHGL